jgi:hypothetical protein
MSNQKEAVEGRPKGIREYIEVNGLFLKNTEKEGG